MNYEVIQHADNLTQYYVQNKVTGRIVVNHVSYQQARETAEALEFTRLLHLSEQYTKDEWPKEINVDTKGTHND